jgi:hypothetical protein
MTPGKGNEFPVTSGQGPGLKEQIPQASNPATKAQVGKEELPPQKNHSNRPPSSTASGRPAHQRPILGAGASKGIKRKHEEDATDLDSERQQKFKKSALDVRMPFHPPVASLGPLAGISGSHRIMT